MVQVAHESREEDVLSLDEDITPPYAEEFINFINVAPTVYHAADYFKTELLQADFIELKEKDDWIPLLKPGGKYFVGRNNSSVVAFAIGAQYSPGGAFAMIASHIDALCMKVKPVSKSAKDGFDRIAVAPYAGGGPSRSFDGSFMTWWDRDLGLGGRVMVKSGGKIVNKLVKLPKPIARIPSLAAHFGEPALGPFNYEINMVPVIGMTKLEGEEEVVEGAMGKQHSARVLKALAKEMGIPVSDIVDFDLELYDIHPATLLGLDSEFISAPRLDDKLCSYAAMTALINATSDDSFLGQSGVISLVGLFDMEETGSVLRHGAKSNYLQTVVERVVEAQVGAKGEDVTPYTTNLIGQTLARSLMISADVTHALNPNFDGIYLPGGPMLNKGVVIACDPNGHMTTNAPSIVMCRTVADMCDCELQLFQIRNDSRSGGTVGPMLSERLGVPAIDMSIPQMSMHSIRHLTGAKDPYLGVKFFEGFFRQYQTVQGMVEVD